MNEITELEQKYYVIKKDDAINFLSVEDENKLKDILNTIYNFRILSNMQINEYLVLNLDDKIDIPYLVNKLVSNPLIKTVYDIRLFLINSILNKR